MLDSFRSILEDIILNFFFKVHHPLLKNLYYRLILMRSPVRLFGLLIDSLMDVTGILIFSLISVRFILDDGLYSFLQRALAKKTIPLISSPYLRLVRWIFIRLHNQSMHKVIHGLLSGFVAYPKKITMFFVRLVMHSIMVLSRLQLINEFHAVRHLFVDLNMILHSGCNRK